MTKRRSPSTSLKNDANPSCQKTATYKLRHVGIAYVTRPFSPENSPMSICVGGLFYQFQATSGRLPCLLDGLGPITKLESLGVIKSAVSIQRRVRSQAHSSARLDAPFRLTWCCAVSVCGNGERPCEQLGTLGTLT